MSEAVAHTPTPPRHHKSEATADSTSHGSLAVWSSLRTDSTLPQLALRRARDGTLWSSTVTLPERHVSEGIPSALDVRLKEIDALAKLGNNWDGDGADAVTEPATASARALLVEVARAIAVERILANPDGGIALYAFAPGRRVGFHAGPDGDMALVLHARNSDEVIGAERHEEIPRLVARAEAFLAERDDDV